MKLLARTSAPLLCCLCACGGAATFEGVRSSRDLTTSANVLFIGNSLTATQTSATGEDMPKVLSRFAASSGKTLTYKEAIDMGQTLQTSWSANIPQPYLTGATHYDYIVLQEYSTLPVQNPTQFYNTAVVTYQPSVQRSLAASGTVLLFENWAVTDISPFATRADYVAALDANYATLSGKLSTPNLIVPLSRAWEKVLATKPQTYLFMDDKHPNDAGVYLDACVFYAVIFGESPVGLPALYLPAADAAFLQGIASAVVPFPARADAGVPGAIDAGVAVDAGATDAGVHGGARDAGMDAGPADAGTGAADAGIVADASVDPDPDASAPVRIPVHASSAGGCSSRRLCRRYILIGTSRKGKWSRNIFSR
jgi:hypothetical protein